MNDRGNRPQPGAGTNARWKYRLALLLAVLPPLALACLVFKYSVNVLRWDEWLYAIFVRDVATGSLSAREFMAGLFAQHYEHRFVFPRLIWIGLAWLTGWNTQYGMALQWLLVCLISFIIYRLCRLTVCPEQRPALLLTALANLFLFAPIGWENWLWGCEFQIHMPLACIVAGLWLCHGQRNCRTKVIGCSLLSFVATFSSANGMLCWALVLPSLWLTASRPAAKALEGKQDTATPSRRPRNLPWLLAYVLFAVGCAAFYLDGYQSPVWPWPSQNILLHPLSATRYFLAYAGQPLGYGFDLGDELGAMLAGTLLSACVITGTIALFKVTRTDNHVIEKALPWLALIAYATVSGMMVAAGRSARGTPHALSSRYVAFSSCLAIGMLFMSVAVIRQLTRQRYFSRDTGLVLTTILVTSLFLGHCASLPTALDAMKAARTNAIAGKIAVAFLEVLPKPDVLKRIVDPSGREAMLARDLKNAGWLSIPLLDSLDIARIEARSPYDRGRIGYAEDVLALSNGTYQVAGWAVLPARHSPAHAVVITAETRKGEAIALNYVAVPYDRRPDVALTFKESRYVRSGWRCAFSPTNLPAGTVAIGAWAYDALSGKAYRLLSDPVLQQKLVLPSNTPP